MCLRRIALCQWFTGLPFGLTIFCFDGGIEPWEEKTSFSMLCRWWPGRLDRRITIHPVATGDGAENGRSWI